MCHTDHLAHAFHTVFRHAIVEFSFVAHDGIHKDERAPFGLFTTIGGYHLGLSFRTDKTSGDGIERESQFFPNRKDALHIVGGFHDIELPVVQRIGDQSRGHVIHRIAHITQYGQHGGRCHLAVACQVVDE